VKFLGVSSTQKKSWEIKTKIAFFKDDSCYSIHFNKTSFFDAQVKVPLLIFYKPNIQDWNWQQICKAENKVLLEIASQQENDMVSELLLSSRLSQGKSNADDLISWYFPVDSFRTSSECMDRRSCQSQAKTSFLLLAWNKKVDEWSDGYQFYYQPKDLKILWTDFPDFKKLWTGLGGERSNQAFFDQGKDMGIKMTRHVPQNYG